jgi:hypothetical protein
MCKILPVTEQVELLLTAILSIAFLVLSHYIIQRTSRKIGGRIGAGIGRLFRPVLTRYHRRKAIKKLQADREAKGVPPIENPDTE